MFKNYLKIAFRNIIRQKGFTAINIIGLSIGIACTLLLTLWITNELNFDHFHKNGEHIYRVVEHQQYSSQFLEVAVTPGPLAVAIKDDFPEIKRSTRYSTIRSYQLKTDRITCSDMNGAFADSDFLQMFTFPILQGNTHPLRGIDEIVLTEHAAKQIFELENPVGKTILINSDLKTITAIISDIPDNSHLQFDYLLPFSCLEKQNNSLTYWGNNSIYTYIELQENSDANLVENKIQNIIKEHNEGALSTLYLQQLNQIHLHSVGMVADLNGMGDARYIVIFSCISIFILIISCINFVSLATARYGNRSREVGMRKVLGAPHQNLICQFLGESILLVGLATIIALVMTELTLPVFNQFVLRNLRLQTFFQPVSLLILIGMVIFLGIIAGIYPAFLLSSFKPVSILNGYLFSRQRGGNFRKILVVLQWSLSIILIICTIILYQQLQYMQNKKIGFNKQQILYTAFYDKSNFDSMKQEILRNPQIDHVTAVSALPLNMNNSTSGAKWEGMNEDESFLIHCLSSEKDFIETFGMKMVAGVSFAQRETKSDDFGVILNETAVKQMQLSNPIGKSFSVWGNEGKIIGVVKDFHFKSLHYPIEPIMILPVSDHLRHDNPRYTVVLVNSDDLLSVKNYLEKITQKYSPEKKIEFSFFDERFAAMYKAEQEMSTILKWFTCLAIFIASLGLLGLTAFLTDKRTKEIGIRKILGAHVSNIIYILSKEFAKWIIFANIIAIPIAYIIMRNALQNFAYRISIVPSVFVITFLISMLLAVFTIIFQTYKKSILNPVEVLKYE